MSLTEPSSPAPTAALFAARGAAKADRHVHVNDDSAAIEIADMRALQAISTKLIQEDAGSLHDAILDAALTLLRSDMASMQLYDAARDGLKLLSSRGFDADKIMLFDWVARDAGTSCAQALRSNARAVIGDVET